MATSLTGLPLCSLGEERSGVARVQDAEGGKAAPPLDICEAPSGQPPWQSLSRQDEAPSGMSEGHGQNPELGL